jgi:hypothetical protein
MAKRHTPEFELEIQTPANGRTRKSTVNVLGEDKKILFTDLADLTSAAEREKTSARVAKQLKVAKAKVAPRLEAAWNDTMEQHRRLREQAEAGSPDSVAVDSLRLLDAAPLTIRRPLSLVGGHSYAASWVTVERSTRRTADGVEHDPPLLTIEDVLLVVRDDGVMFGDGAPGARPLAELGLPVRLPFTVPPGRGWSGAGVKRFVAGERPGPADVFSRLVSVVDRFLDFSRSLAPQETMCELVACYVLGTYFLDAFHVVGYLWPNGEHGAGKTHFLHVVAETAYLGHVILAGSSYACLRDLADYGATLAFDDAEAVMDARRTDPDKSTLLLAGNRRGATVAVKEPEGDRWVTRHVDTFCPRCFSAIKLPGEVLGSRSIIVPLVRSGDPCRAKANPLDAEDWPCDRRRLVDDLWALGLAHLRELPAFDREAAAAASLAGRNLDPWRLILGVAGWLQHGHGMGDLFDRLEALSVAYQGERAEAEAEDRTRVLFRALLELSRDAGPDDAVKFRPADVARVMNRIGVEEDLCEADKAFTSARRVGWLLKRQRFRKCDADEHGKQWEATRKEIEAAACSYGMEVPEETPF